MLGENTHHASHNRRGVTEQKTPTSRHVCRWHGMHVTHAIGYNDHRRCGSDTTRAGCGKGHGRHFLWGVAVAASTRWVSHTLVQVRERSVLCFVVHAYHVDKMEPVLACTMLNDLSGRATATRLPSSFTAMHVIGPGPSFRV